MVKKKKKIIITLYKLETLVNVELKKMINTSIEFINCS